MITALHPHEYVRWLLEVTCDVHEIELSTYINVPESLSDVRESVRVPVNAVADHFAGLLGSLSPDQEIAFHSRVHVRGLTGGLRSRHFPLVDFKTTDRTLAESAAERLIGECGAPNAAFFASGHSYHLYIGVLLSPTRWTAFMGRLLLLNPREGPAVVDGRWIGHRLMSGFGALRWSANTAPYTQPPLLLRRWTETSEGVRAEE